MIAQVTDCADSIGAVRMRSPLSRRSSWKVLTTQAMLPRPVGLAIDESHRLPVLVDRGALVVDEAGLKADALDGVEVEVGVELGRFLRPRDPQAVRGRERPLQRREAPLELGGTGREVDEDVGARLRAELLRQLNQGAAALGTPPRLRTRSHRRERARRQRGSGT